MVTKLRPGFQFKTFLNLVRALFPHWNFFDRIASHFELSFKIPGSTEWSLISFDEERKIFGLLVNPQCNLSLAHVNIIEHFAADIQQLQQFKSGLHSKDVQKLSTFKMICSLLRLKLSDYSLKTNSVQFKISAVSPSEEVVIYISDWLPMESDL